MSTTGLAARRRKFRSPTIDWDYEGNPDPLVGTGASFFEQLLFWLAGAGGAALMIFLSGEGYVGWTWFETAIAAVLAFDLIGGAVAFNLNSAKRFYHAPPKDAERGLIRLMKRGGYVPATHVHPIVVYLLYKPDEVLTGVAIYLATALAVAITRLAPLHLARPVAVILVLAATLASAYAVRPVAGFEWLMPVLFLKLVLGFGVREEPYRPRPRG